MHFSERNEFRNYFVERFGIPERYIARFRFLQRGKKVWAFTGTMMDVQGVEAMGIKALTISGAPKPSTAFLRIVGEMATKNVVHLDWEDGMRYLRGEDIEGEFLVDDGYVIVRTKDMVLGCGFYRGKLINQIPKKYRMESTWV